MDDRQTGPLEPLGEGDLERRRLACCRAILQLRWMVGRWHGTGTSSGERVTSNVETKAILGGTFLESRERTYRLDGALEHEDFMVYGAAPEQGSAALWGQLFMSAGVSTRYSVDVYGEAVLCEPDGYGARISLMREDDGYRGRVYFPDSAGLWVEESTLHYRRLE